MFKPIYLQLVITNIQNGKISVKNHTAALPTLLENLCHTGQTSSPKPLISHCSSHCSLHQGVPSSFFGTGECKRCQIVCASCGVTAHQYRGSLRLESLLGTVSRTTRALSMDTLVWGPGSLQQTGDEGWIP